MTSTSTSTTTADALVMFGLTGDLGEKKLLPAILELARSGRLPSTIIGVGRSERTEADLWEMLIDATDESARDLKGQTNLSYVSGDSAEDSTYQELAERLGDVECLVVYAALPPDLFGGVARGLASAGLADRARLVIEKPFGNDAASARELFDELTDVIDVDRLFAVDHFLAKSTVENLLTFRTANPMIEAALRTGVVEQIELTMAESFGVDGRGSFYDGVGAVRDVVQNHLLQTLAVLLMEPPADDSGEALADARSHLLSAIRPIDATQAVLGQFDGYRDIDDVDAESHTETFVAARLVVDNERWRDVPILLRTGKHLTETFTEAVITFAGGSAPSRLRFGLKPAPTIVMELSVLHDDAGDADRHGELDPVVLWACAPSNHGALGDYATMLAGAIDGDHRHFARIADIEAAWQVVDPLLRLTSTPQPYDRSTMGPPSADSIVPGNSWTPGPLRPS